MKHTIFCCIFLLAVKLSYAAVIPMSQEEMIAASESIFVGKVIAKKSHFNKQKFIVTDYTFEVDKTLYGVETETIKLTFAGGEVGNTIIKVSEVPEFRVGEEVLLMAESLDKPLFSPVIGGTQGQFVAQKVKTSEGIEAVAVSDANVMTQADGQAIPFSHFVTEIENKIQKVKKGAHEGTVVQAQSFPNYPNSKKYDASTTCDDLVPSSVTEEQQNTNPIAKNYLEPPLPKQKIRSTHTVSLVEAGSSLRAMQQEVSAQAVDHRIWKSLPIVFIPLPTSDPVFKGSDQRAMSEWNRFLKAFRVRAFMKTWALGNRCNDMVGFFNDRDLKEHTGHSYSKGVMAMAITHETGFFQKAVETDIVFNPAYRWTANKYDVYDSSYQGLGDNMLHELGHALGLDHLFNATSIMNFAEKKYQTYSRLYTVDIYNMARNYPNYFEDFVKDVGVRFYETVGYQTYGNTGEIRDKTGKPTHVIKTGELIKIGGIILENNSRIEAVLKDVEIHLCRRLHDVKSCKGIGFIFSENRPGRIRAHGWIRADNMEVKIPENFSAGTYFILVFAGRGDSYGGNNEGWWDRPIEVIPAPKPSPGGGGGVNPRL